MKELDIQRQIVKSCKKQGGYGLKMDNRFVAGIPDLLLSLPICGPALIEIKVKGNYPTPLQKKTLADMREAGIAAGLATIKQESPGRFVIVMSNGHVLLKPRGEEWPVKEMIQNCTKGAVL